MNVILCLIVLCFLSLFIDQINAASTNNNNKKKDFPYSLEGKPYYYIYEWPNELDDVWPPYNTTLHPKSTYDHSFNENGGAGKMLIPDLGLFQTWQFSLYKNVMSRLRTSPQRTYDPSQASAFIIPFDGGVHSYIDHLNGRPRLASPHGWQAIQLLKQAQQNTSTFWKYHGHNHFVFFSITIFQMVGIGVKTFWMTICQNCTSIVIETSPTNTAISGRSNKYWYAAPYPSSYHWWEGIKELPWIMKEKTKREIFVLFIGSVKTSNTKNNLLRRTLFQQCKSYSTCQWYPTSHSCNGVVNATSQMLLFRQARFCPAPPGDSITRKSIFDALIAGCIPVIFAKASLSQYIWYFTETEIKEVSVFIPQQSILDQGANFIEILQQISDEELISKQQAIARIAPRLQYAVVPSHLQGGNHPGQVWSPPFEDAVDVIISKILDRRTIEPLNGFSDLDLTRQKCMQNDIMQNHADYAGLFPGQSKGRSGNNVAERIWKANRCELYNRTEGFQAPTFTVQW